MKRHIVNVIGLGYIGLPIALMFATHNIEIVATDYNKELIKTLNSGGITFEERGLDDLFESAVTKGVKFSDKYISADTYIVAVPTPYDKLTKNIDTSFLVEAIEEIIQICPKGAIIVIESTVSPGTTDKVIRPIIEGKDINIVHAPERIIPGNIIHELKYNPRIIGADDIIIGKKIKKLYTAFCQGNITITNILTAEMTKVVENTYRDVNIAFANELAKICRKSGVDVYEIIRMANMHPRVNILQPGPGVGGHCIPVDPWFLVGDYPELAEIILTARKINDSMPIFVLERIYEIIKENNIKDLTRVGLYGLTYKENIDDIRESPTLQLLRVMKKCLAQSIKIYDPYIKNEVIDNQYYDLDKFLEEVDLIIIMVAHDEIKNNINKLDGKLVLDAKNINNLQDSYKL